MVVRDMDYLNWRYATTTGVDYQIKLAENKGEACGYLVLRTIRWEQVRVRVIFDLLSTPLEINQCLLTQAVRQCWGKRLT